MEPIQIKDSLTLREVAINMATSIMTAIGYQQAYDINNHLALAKGIEEYIRGNVELPEVYNSYEDSLLKIVENFKGNSSSVSPDNLEPNFKVESETI